MPSEYGVNVTFNVSDLTLFNVPSGSIIKARAKKLKEALKGLVQNIWSKMDLEEIGTPREHEGQPLIHLIKV